MLAHDRRLHDALTVDHAAQAPRPRRVDQSVGHRTAIERRDIAAMDRTVIGHDNRNRRIELPKPAQHPILARRLIMPLDPHRAEQLLGDLDLPLTMRALIAAMTAKLARVRHPRQIALRIPLTNAVQRLTRHHMKIPRLRVQGRRRPHREFNHLPDQSLRHRHRLKPTNTPPPQNNIVVLHAQHSKPWEKRQITPRLKNRCNPIRHAVTSAAFRAEHDSSCSAEVWNGGRPILTIVELLYACSSRAADNVSDLRAPGVAVFDPSGRGGALCQCCFCPYASGPTVCAF